MKQADRRCKQRTIVAFAILVTIIALITFVGSILFLEPIARYMYLHNQGSYISGRKQITLFETLVVNLRHCIWIGLLLAPIVGWRYAQAKLSGRVTVGALSVIAIVEIAYLLVVLWAAVLQGVGIWAGSSGY